MEEVNDMIIATFSLSDLYAGALAAGLAAAVVGASIYAVWIGCKWVTKLLAAVSSGDGSRDNDSGYSEYDSKE